MSRNKLMRQNYPKIDKRSTQDIQNRIRELAASYVPEWQFDTDNPDIGSTLGILFSKQMYENIGKYNQVIDKYHTELVNMTGISLLPAKPASSVVLMELVQDTISGVEVKKKSRLLAQNKDRQIIFETSNNIYVTSSRIVTAFMTDGDNGHILPVLGDFEPIKLIDEEPSREDYEENDKENDKNSLSPFRLFDADRQGIEVNAVVFYHENVFDIENDNIYVRFCGNTEIPDRIKQGSYTFLYYTKQGIIPVEHVEYDMDSQTVILKKEQKNKRLNIDGLEMSALILKAVEPVKENCKVDNILFASSGKECKVEFAGNGTTDYDVKSFKPFGDTLSLYQECYIGHNIYFGKKGAHIRLCFDVSYHEHKLSLTRQQEDEELKIIKKKPKNIWVDQMADAYAEEISIEYFNGIGWKKLSCEQEYRAMFFTDKNGHYELSFSCPDDWSEVTVGAYDGRCIRVRLLKSDNCYLRPVIHHYPHIENMKLSFSYDDNYAEPQKAVAIAGTSKKDITPLIKSGREYMVFSKGKYSDDSLYLGFSRKMETGPVSILFILEDRLQHGEVECRFEYSTPNGFKQMEIVDHTSRFSKSGVIMFTPPSDMSPMTIEGKRAYWLRLTRISRKQGTMPEILDICLNAVEVQNIETRQEQDYYIEEIQPNMVFDLSMSDILDIDLWVNEMGSHTAEEMRMLHRQMPERVRFEYNMLGEISAFYVKWEETEQPDTDKRQRVYSLDRMSRQLIFGDGVHTRIPRVLDNVAFKIIMHRSSGQAGNVEAGDINEALGNLLFIDNITNPIKAFGGSNMESTDSALLRGANRISARSHLVSLKDYEREIMEYSDNIDKVGSVLGMTVDGVYAEDSITFVLLFKDFEDGSYSFHHEAGKLKKHLLESCELTLAADDMHIVQPVFVTISVDIWVELYDMEEHFDVQTMLNAIMSEYLNPVSTAVNDGWEIGTLPKLSQIMMKLAVISDKAVIKKTFVSGTYTDEKGFHQSDISEIECTPFMICRNGVHKLHTI